MPFKCKFCKISVCYVNAAICICVVPILQYKIIIKLHVNDLEVIHSDIDSLTTGQGRNKVHLIALKITALCDQHTQHN